MSLAFPHIPDTRLCSLLFILMLIKREKKTVHPNLMPSSLQLFAFSSLVCFIVTFLMFLKILVSWRFFPFLSCSVKKSIKYKWRSGFPSIIWFWERNSDCSGHQSCCWIVRSLSQPIKKKFDNIDNARWLESKHKKLKWPFRNQTKYLQSLSAYVAKIQQLLTQMCITKEILQHLRPSDINTQNSVTLTFVRFSPAPLVPWGLLWG